MNAEGSTPRLSEKYLDVVRLDDGRYCVRFMKHGFPPRTSYSRGVDDVVTQALRAGSLPVYTHDEELQRACADRQVEIII